MGGIISVITNHTFRLNPFRRQAICTMASDKFVQDAIAASRVVIFSKSYCPYCTMAKEQFDKLKFPYTAIELNQLPQGLEYQEFLGTLTGASTVPRVFVDGKFIGGGTDVKKLYDNGALQKMLA